MNKKIQISLTAILFIAISTSASQEELRLLNEIYKKQLQKLSSQNLGRFFDMKNKHTEEVITNSLFGQIVQYANNDYRYFGRSKTLASILYSPEVPLEVKKKVQKLFNPEYYQSEISPIAVRVYLEYCASTKDKKAKSQSQKIK